MISQPQIFTPKAHFYRSTLFVHFPSANAIAFLLLSHPLFCHAGLFFPVFLLDRQQFILPDARCQLNASDSKKNGVLHPERLD